MTKRSPRELLGEMFSTQAKDLERFIRRRIPNEEDARDLAQEAFIRILRMGRVEFINHPEQYLLRVAANLASEHRLRLRNSFIDANAQIPENSVSEELNSEEIAQLEQQMKALKCALKTLPPNVQAALLWHRRDGLTYEQIAERLGVSASMVKKYLQTGVARCRAQMKEAD